MNVFQAVMLRYLRVAFRRWSELAHPLIFFVIVVTLFPLALSPTALQLREVGVGVLWVAKFLILDEVLFKTHHPAEAT